jgi:hypothetical protein
LTPGIDENGPIFPFFNQKLTGRGDLPKKSAVVKNEKACAVAQAEERLA